MSDTADLPLPNRRDRRRAAALQRSGRMNDMESSAESREKQNPTMRAMLLALGFDPDVDRLYRRTRPEGLLVTDSVGRPVRFYSKRQVARLMDDSFKRELAALIEGESAEPAKDPA